MLKFLLTALTLVASPAFAADLPARPAPVQKAAPTINDWGGLYIGGQAGYAWTRDKFDTPLTDISGVLGTFKPAGFAFGGYGGYAVQAGNWVPYLEVDFTWLGKSASKTMIPVEAAPVTISAEVKYLGSVRAGLGYLVTSNLKAYVTGGAGFGAAESALVTGDVRATAANTHFGWVVGGGLETELLPKVYVRAQILHYDLGKATGLALATSTDRLTVDQATLGLHLKF